jgi:hypothetical protein
MVIMQPRLDSWLDRDAPVQPMQQRDQARPALIGDAASVDPGANLAGCPRQRLGDPGLQFVLLRIAPA